MIGLPIITQLALIFAFVASYILVGAALGTLLMLLDKTFDIGLYNPHKVREENFTVIVIWPIVSIIGLALCLNKIALTIVDKMTNVIK